MKALPVLLLTILMAVSHHAYATPTSAGTDTGEIPVPQGKVIKYGIYKARSRGHIEADATASTGKVIKYPKLELVKATHRVPIKKGVYFAYQYMLHGLPTDLKWVELKRVLTHPEIVLPDGSRTRRSERTLRKRVQQGIAIAFDGYALYEAYEMVPGKWTFQIWYQNRLLAEQTFTTY